MKHLLCHLAQRNPSSTGPLAKHVSRCKECEEFFAQVLALESRLVVPAGDSDLDLCAGILAGISSGKRTPVIEPARPWLFSPMALSTFVALLMLIMGLLAAHNFKKPAELAKAPAEAVVPVQSATPERPREMTLAYAMQQQELLQRDAMKLGAHLRENLILFQVAEK